MSVHALIIASLVVIVTRRAIRAGGRQRVPGDVGRWRRPLPSQRWSTAAVSLASLLVFLTSALAIDYWQGLATALHAGLSQDLGLTNFSTHHVFPRLAN